ncbi:MAG: type II toxin-antitoxin system RelE/ParE family toxin [Pseudomonadota bacterium]
MVKWTDHAKAQLRHIHDYIAQDSPIYAKRVADALVRKTLGLDQLPRIGRMVPEINEDTVREIPLYTYRILYEITPQHVAVLAVIHKRRDLQPEDVPREQ